MSDSRGVHYWAIMKYLFTLTRVFYITALYRLSNRLNFVRHISSVLQPTNQTNVCAGDPTKRLLNLRQNQRSVAEYWEELGRVLGGVTSSYRNPCRLAAIASLPLNARSEWVCVSSLVRLDSFCLPVYFAQDSWAVYWSIIKLYNITGFFRFLWPISRKCFFSAWSPTAFLYVYYLLSVSSSLSLSLSPSVHSCQPHSLVLGCGRCLRSLREITLGLHTSSDNKTVTGGQRDVCYVAGNREDMHSICLPHSPSQMVFTCPFIYFLWPYDHFNDASLVTITARLAVSLPLAKDHLMLMLNPVWMFDFQNYMTVAVTHL